MNALRAASRRATQRAAFVGGAFCIASLLATALVAARMRPLELDAVLADFRGAWAGGDPAEVAGFLHPELRAHREEWLAGVLAGYGWRGAAPPLGAEAVRAAEDGTWVEHAVGGVRLSTCWVPAGRGWTVAAIDLPPPPVEPALDAFARAWRHSDARAISELFPAGYEDRMLAYLDRLARRRGWSRFPAILGSERTRGPDGEEVVTLSTERDRITVKWVFRGDGVWGLKGLNVTER
jgi:hypothetical protein